MAGDESNYRYGGIPGPTVRRLSLYHRELENLLDGGAATVSSRQLGQALGLTDAQVRKDFAYFGQFGQAGIGYDVEELIQRVRHILGTDRRWNCCLVGAGNLGRALLSYRGFARKQFHIVAAFDADPALVGTAAPTMDTLRIQPMSALRDVVQREEIRVGLLCVPAAAAQAVADDMVQAGIRGILSFAAMSLSLPPDVDWIGVDLAVHLEQLSYRLTSRDRDAGDGQADRAVTDSA